MRLQSALDTSNDSTMRGYLFKTAIDMFMHDSGTALFGNGLGSYDHTVGIIQGNGKPGMWYPHNFLLELLAEYGLVGTVLYLAPMLVLLLAHSERRAGIGQTAWPRSSDAFRVAALAVMGFVWIISMTSGGLRLNWVVFFFMYLALAAPPSLRPGPGGGRPLSP
jgi:O-antigen ligase